MIRRRLVYNKVDLTPIDWRFYLSLGVAILLTINFYYFILGFREFFRHHITREYSGYASLTPLRLYLYNVFYAFLSTLVGFMAFTKLWMSANVGILRRISSSVVIDQQMMPGNFIYLFLKISFFYCFIIFNNTVFNYIDVARDLWPIFILGPIVLFVHQWMTLRRRVKQATFKAMVLAGGGQLFFSCILAAVPLYDIQRLDELARKRIPTEMLRVQVPTTKFRGTTSRHWTTVDLHVGYRKDNGELALSFGDFRSDFITMDTLVARYRKEQVNMYGMTWPKTVSPEIALYADTDMPASQALEIIKRLRVNGKISYTLISNDGNDRFGLPLLSDGYCRDLSDKLGLNYTRVVDWSGDTFEFYKPYPCWDEEVFEYYEFFNLSLKDNKLLLNDTIVSTKQLYDWAYSRIISQQETKGKFTGVFVTVDDVSTYSTLIGAAEQFYTALVDIRTQKLKEHSGHVYEPNHFLNTMDFADVEFVKEFEQVSWMIWTPEEEEFYRDLVNKFKPTQTKFEYANHSRSQRRNRH